MSAVILAMPAKVQRIAKRRLDKVELDAQHRWVMSHRTEWGNVETDGRCYSTPLDELMRPHLNRICGLTEPTMAMMRKDNAAGRKLIKKRNRVKQWLADKGADNAAMRSAESALFFLFDHSQERERV